MSRTDEVVEGVKRMILDGELSPGDRLPVEKDLAAALGVSRGSLREGVRALTILGVLDTRQGDGTYVTSLDPGVMFAPMGFVVDLQADDLAQRFHSVRRLLESEAAALAARHIDAAGAAAARAALDDAAAVLADKEVDHERMISTDIAFHRALAGQCGNPVLAALVESMGGRTVRARLWRGIREEGADRRTHAEHEAVLDAVLSGDADRARLRMAVHLLGVEEFVLRERDGGPGE